MVDTVTSALPPPLLPAGGLSALRSVAAEIPFIPLAAFECHLGAQPLRVDLQTGGPSTGGTLTSYLEDVIGGRITAVAGLTERFVETIWFEFDVASGTERAAPAVFVGLRPGEPVDAGRLRALAAMLLGGIDDATARLLRRCSDAVSGDTEITHVGAMRGRPDRPLRVNVGATSSAALEHYAAAIGLADERRAALAGLLRTVDPLTHHYLLALDLAGAIRPRFGLECYLRTPDDLGGWRALLDRFVELGACTAAQASAVLRWPGHAPAPADDGRLPRLRPIDRFLGRGGPDTIVRTLNHVKLVSAPGAAVTSKAYFLARRVRGDDAR